ncbi:MAG: T9SS type A sorting domain-containing protein, partial [Bacteroidia bacterium]
TETYEENERLVNEIYLSTLVQGIYLLDENQVSILEGIIHQCPLSGGKAVYRARALYAMYNLEENYEDTEVCGQQGISWRTNQPTQVATLSPLFSVAPNPANHEVNITFDNVLQGKELYLYNSLGQLAKTIVLPIAAHTLKLMTSDLVSGVYTLKSGSYTTKLILISE